MSFSATGTFRFYQIETSGKIDSNRKNCTNNKSLLPISRVGPKICPPLLVYLPLQQKVISRLYCYEIEKKQKKNKMKKKNRVLHVAQFMTRLVLLTC